jgi:PKD repeat protein
MFKVITNYLVLGLMLTLISVVQAQAFVTPPYDGCPSSNFHDYTDAVYGAQVRQIDYPSGNEHGVYYWRQAFNVDHSYMVLIRESLDFKAPYDVSLYTGNGCYIKHLFSTPTYDWRVNWSRTDPAILYTDKGTGTLYSLDVNTVTFTPLITESQGFRPAGPSLNQAGDRIMMVTTDQVVHSWHLPDMGSERTFSISSTLPTTGGYHVDWGHADISYIGYQNYIGNNTSDSTGANYALVVTDDTGSAIHTFLGSSGNVGNGYKGHYAFGPSGKLAYYQQQSATLPFEIHVVNDDGTNDKLLLQVPKTQAAEQSLHLSWPSKVNDWFVAGIIPSAGLITSTEQPILDQLIQFNVTTGAVTYLARSATNEKTPFVTFWSEEQPSMSPDGSRFEFNSVCSNATTLPLPGCHYNGSIDAYILYVQPPGTLQASITAVPTSGSSPLAVAFTGLATGGTQPYTYSWNFGDSGTSTAQSPSHTYAAPGTYTATLTVTDNTSATAVSTQTISVSTSSALAASATASPVSGTPPLAVTFTGSATGGTSPYTYAWVFGDGGTSTTQSPSHTYSNAGTYTATLTVTDNVAATATSSQTITVTNPAPVASMTATPTSGTAPLLVTFTGSVTGGTSPYVFSWDFGDGSPKSSVQNPTHTYSTNGTYTATLTVTDSKSATDSASQAITVSSASGVTASATANPTSGPPPLSVSFAGSATGGTSPYTYSWNFGDGSRHSAAQNPVHVYSSAGSYTAVLTVTDSGAVTSTASQTITVATNPALAAVLTANPISGSAPLAVAFTGLGTGGAQPYSYLWDFGDGSSTSTTQNPNHTYSVGGNYTATLTVTDNAAATASATQAITVANAVPLAASSTALPLSGSAPLSVSFTGSATGGTQPYTYSWNFGDSSTPSTNQNPTHTYSNAGVYTVTLTATDNNSATATSQQTITVTVPAICQ